MTDRKTFKRGREAGRHWAITCDPADRRRFWKNRRDLEDSDFEGVFEAIFDDDDDYGDGDDLEARCEDFWGMEEGGDPPPEDFVRGFVAGALTIISVVEKGRRTAKGTLATTHLRPASKQKTRR